MRRRHPLPPRPPMAVALQLDAADLLPFASDGPAERTRMRWAIGVAAVAHALLFLLTLPEVSRVIVEPEPQEVFLITPVRFEPPPPPPPTPPARAERVPVPDPTPDAPEPIRPMIELASIVELPGPILTGIPEAPPPIPDPRPLRVGGDVAAPVKLFAPQPRYTEMARKAREEGIVIVEAVIDETGAVTGAKILKGLRFGLDEEALGAVERWRFEPATLSGKPVAVLYNVTIHFTLR